MEKKEHSYAPHAAMSSEWLEHILKSIALEEEQAERDFSWWSLGKWQATEQDPHPRGTWATVHRNTIVGRIMSGSTSGRASPAL